ncbi:uncharacterized protein LOC129958962 [Argiope bruennichi]|uniref:uncharacterized protein LOC129958962 n=1 Tax=Argiope bruennichi TaxID=94029 RepID=UPI002495105B|nr:uncharacterized protein LOC129958962 [Argiope bruennichi]
MMIHYCFLRIFNSFLIFSSYFIFTFSLHIFSSFCILTINTSNAGNIHRQKVKEKTIEMSLQPQGLSAAEKGLGELLKIETKGKIELRKDKTLRHPKQAPSAAKEGSNELEICICRWKLQ